MAKKIEGLSGKAKKLQDQKIEKAKKLKESKAKPQKSRAKTTPPKTQREKEVREGKAKAVRAKNLSELEVQERRTFMMMLIKENRTYYDCIATFREHFNHDATVNATEAVYTACRKELRKDYADKVKDIRDDLIASYERDIQLAFAEYMQMRAQKNYLMANKWFQTYLVCKTKLEEFYPSLKVEEKDDNVVIINISPVTEEEIIEAESYTSLDYEGDDDEL